MNRQLPAEVYALVEHTPATVLLDGGRQNCSEGNKKTRLFTAPARVCAAWQTAEIPALFAEIESAVAAGMCAAGFFSYECGHCFEPKAAMRASRHGEPLAWFGIYERGYLFDHAKGEFIGGEPPELAHFQEKDQPAKGHDFTDCEKSRFERLCNKGTALAGPFNSAQTTGALAPALNLTAEFALAEAEYTRRIAAIHELIRAGDVYQLNFTAPFRIETQGSAAALYARLRARQPVDYGAFLHWEQDRFIQSFSPELFFRVEDRGAGRHIVTRPMKGTAPRGRTAREDREIAEWLRNDPKNRAENVMIVDLLRNDLGRVAKTGSVRAERLFEVERYPTLWQMTSTVTAELRPEVGYHEIFRALFPSGSVTGAPKVRAMQSIAELEDAPRGVYTGAIGFFSPRETVFNVAIRTLELEAGRGGDLRGIMGAGSGVVIDSDAAAEYRECLLKGQFLIAAGTTAPGDFKLLESLLWRGEYPLLEQHLDRLADSAEYFDFACQRESARTALLHHVASFTGAGPRKVRLLLAADGTLNVESEAIAEETLEPSARPLRARMARTQTDSSDRMLYHKTTHRPLYAEELAAAARDGFDEVIFTNEREEITEGAHNNVFAVVGGRWITPPVECGLLAGVYRQHLLATRPEIEERVLTLDNLRAAGAIYLANAVRGLRRVTIDW
jgi:para-aminobenzoate synthetase/4-amino-4-deoxychorismate lyase